MAHPLILPLDRCRAASLVGGKALGLARLLAAGFPVPPGFCITTEAYRQVLRACGASPMKRWQQADRLVGEDRRRFLSECQTLVRSADVSALVEQSLAEMRRIASEPDRRWAVRSSATNEDAGQSSFAGLYRTELGVSITEIGPAITNLWASLWDERVIQYMTKQGLPHAPSAMAVVLQPMLDAEVAGVAYAIHPLTGRSNQVLVNAVRGLAAPLVDGLVEPDQYVVEMSAGDQPAGVRRRILCHQSEKLIVTVEGLRNEPVPATEREWSSLSDEQLFELARMAKGVERACRCPVDLEWVFDTQRLWVLQARPITAVSPSSDLINEECEWSRANFKETMPELPSPLGLSFLEHFMESYIIARYRWLGCKIPEGLSSVRILHGRPYINLSLFHSLVGQLDGETSFMAEQLGGERLTTVPVVKRLDWLRLARAAALIFGEMRTVVKYGPLRFEEMKQLAVSNRCEYVQDLSVEELAARLDGLGRWLNDHECTFGIAAGVGQCLQTFSRVLPRWLGEDWRSLLNAALQGQGTVISAQQILRLAELVHMARQDPAVLQILTAQGQDVIAVRRLLKGTTFLQSFDRYLEDYGHRGVGESDVMSPRFADHPEALIEVIRAQLHRSGFTPADIMARQRSTRENALATIRARCGWRFDRWIVFQWWYRRLCLFFSLREANRHHLMYYAMAVRNLLLRFGECLVERGVFTALDDVFFLTLQERAQLISGLPRDWSALVSMRRAERDRWAAMQVPDTVRDWEDSLSGAVDSAEPGFQGVLRGIPISLGCVTGPVRLVRSTADWSKVHAGDIIVAPVIDPGMAPLFSIAAGLIVEMGGTLSHGAIIAREYGLPAVVNVRKVISALRDGDHVRLDAGAGEVTLQCPAEGKECSNLS